MKIPLSRFYWGAVTLGVSRFFTVNLQAETVTAASVNELTVMRSYNWEPVMELKMPSIGKIIPSPKTTTCRSDPLRLILITRQSQSGVITLLIILVSPKAVKVMDPLVLTAIKDIGLELTKII
jgi:hypothetical protein